MIPAWSLGVILLGYVFGFPVPFNSTQNGSRQYEYETLPQLNDKVDNSTEPFMSNDTESNETEIPFHFQMMLPMENMSPLLDYDHAIPSDTVIAACLTTQQDPLQTSNLILPSFQSRGSASLCYLPTCMNSNLGSALQKGDEIAGASTKDPHGIGRK
ncbi:uncharacterized protein zgc:193726 isoform X2 [Coregonus clupeaformis]|uniref:uncharacterized protein zgc:193726 isoform X2 n=1 Tax=Coregonus clupeaformis TaxID=59861 RepID=UPI001BE0BEDF|nr:uncharacterized protein zgc:193726 isoform X2 [Coregonus clupeaformis]